MFIIKEGEIELSEKQMQKFADKLSDTIVKKIKEQDVLKGSDTFTLEEAYKFMDIGRNKMLNLLKQIPELEPSRHGKKHMIDKHKLAYYKKHGKMPTQNKES